MVALVIGCGYLGSRVARAWVLANRRVVALTRGRAAELRARGLEPLVGDVLDPPPLPAADVVLYSVGLDRTSGHGMREVYVEGLRRVLAALPPGGRFLYVSSTSVYAQADGAVVDEQSPTEPVEEAGRVVLDAEGELRAMWPDAIVLRFAGIYGPGRVLRQRALMKGEAFVGDADKWLNLIHVEDGVRAVLTAEGRGVPGETYLVADGAPVRRRDFYARAATVLGAPPATFEAGPPPRGEANRRVSNARLRALGWAPRYPSYVEGLAASATG